MYKINDLVKYQGSLNVFSNNFARIIGFENFNDIEMVHLLSMRNNQKFWGDYADIQHIKLEEKHLINLGFKKNEVQNLTLFTLDDIIVYKSFSILDNSSSNRMSALDKKTLASYSYSIINIGFVLDNNTNPIDFKHYLLSEKFDSTKFYQDFKSMENLISLFDYLRQHHKNIKFDETKISTL